MTEKKSDSNATKKKPNLQDTSPTYKAVRPFLIGGMAGSSATCCIQPIDMVKVRIQLQGEGTGGAITTNPLKIGAQIIKSDGVAGLYKGLGAAILRQCTYGTTRLGVFRSLTDYLKPANGTAADIPFLQICGASLVAGGVGALIGTPADAALVRMQSDATLPIDQRRGYKNAFDALFRMAREEGLAGFFSGASPTVFRGLLINLGMLTTYDAFKGYLGEYLGGYDSQSTRFVCGALSGWCAATVSLPADFVKTRLQKMRKGPDGSVPYKGLFDCISKTVANEGPMAFYQGYPTFVIRITPHIMLTWVFMDNYKNWMEQIGV
jgi:solute carrier family 25 oxoglutarate transporter 11